MKEDSPEFKLALMRMEEALADAEFDAKVSEEFEPNPLGLSGAEAIIGAEGVLRKVEERRDQFYLELMAAEADAENVSAEDGLRAMLRYHEYAGAVTVTKTLVRLLKRRNGDL